MIYGGRLIIYNLKLTKMDLLTAIIGFGALAVCILPLVYFQMAEKKKRNKFLNDFLLSAAEQKVVVTQHEVWGHYYGLGLDARANKLAYLKRWEAKEERIVIDLSEVEKCRVININRTVNDNKIIEQIGLAFSFRNPGLSEKILEFYNKEESMSLNDELLLVEKWAAICSARLQATKKAA